MVLQIVMVAASVILLGGATWRQVQSIRIGSVSANPAAWLILTAVSAVSLIALYRTSTTPVQMVLPFVQFFSTIVIFLVAVCNWTSNEKLKMHDLMAAWACVMGVAAGLWLHSPVATLIGNLLAYLAGLWPMVAKGRDTPSDIDKLFWIGRGASSIAAFAAFWFSDDRTGTIPQTTGILMAGVMLTVSLLPARLPKRVRIHRAPMRLQPAGPYMGNSIRWF